MSERENKKTALFKIESKRIKYIEINLRVERHSENYKKTDEGNWSWHK